MGATPEELATLSAQLADEAMFRRYGADRPSYLSSVRFKVATNSQGRPVLEVHSAQPFADPIVNFLVDIRWPKGELIRDFSLLLDPAVYPPASQLASAAAASEGLAELRPTSVIALPPAAARSPVIIADSAASAGSMTIDPASAVPPADHKRFRLSRDGARHPVRHRAPAPAAVTRDEALQMMIAVFRANPDAFDRNINIPASWCRARDALGEGPGFRERRGGQAQRRPADEGLENCTASGRISGPFASGVIAVPPSVQAEAQSGEVEKLNSRVQSLEEALEAEQRQVAGLKATIEASRQTGRAATGRAARNSAQGIAHAGRCTSRTRVPFGTDEFPGPGPGAPAPGSGDGAGMAPATRADPTSGAAASFLRTVTQAIAAPAPVQSSGADQSDATDTTVAVQLPEEATDAPPPANDEVTTTTEVDAELLEQLEADYAATRDIGAGRSGASRQRERHGGNGYGHPRGAR